MKIAVYTIAKNEEQFVDRWYESAKDADYLLIADTGSSDNTVKKAKRHKINVINISINPWRFDDARNASLSSIPNDIDYCIALDMDEVLMPGWRAELEKALADGVTRPRYKYTWSWNKDGSPGLQYGGDKIHARKGYRWRHPVHEVIVADRIEEKQDWYDLEIHHYPDNSKSRGQYLPLLKLSTLEDPSDDRNAYYYARELYFYKMFKEAAKEFERHLLLPKATWKPERSSSMRYLAKCKPNDAKYWLEKAVEEDPQRREPMVELANWGYENNDWRLTLKYSEKALSIINKPLDYLCEEFAWGYLPYDLAAIASYHLGDKKKALEYGQIAASLNPDDLRLKDNLSYYTT
jgi:glycosyltransferase involved in cell wall biosynthesis